MDLQSPPAESLYSNTESTAAVAAVLRNASCQQPELIRPAEQQLQQWEKQPGFYLTLLQIYLNQVLEKNTRWMAVLCFKNGVDKFWRNIGEHKIADEEKVRIRAVLEEVCYQVEPLPHLAVQVAVCTSKVARQDCPHNWPQLLPNLLHLATEVCYQVEPLPHLAVQVAVCTSKVARQDCPHNWPQLLPNLLHLATGGAPPGGGSGGGGTLQQRALLTLHHVIKQISSKRLMHDKRKFQDIASKLFPELHTLYKMEVERFFSPADAAASEDVGTSLQRAHYCLKILRQLANYGFKTPSEVQHVAEFYRSVCEQAKAMLLFRKQHEGDALKGPSEKYANLLMKCLLELLENYPYCFLNYLENVLRLVTTLVFTDEGNSVLYERFTVQSLCMIKSILDCPEYQVNKIIEETKSPEALQAYKIKSEFFTNSVLEQICHRLITQYFLLSRDDLEVWESDPEMFCTEVEGGDSWKFSLRPATECLFKKMFHDYREPFTRVVLSLMNDAVKMTDPSNFQGLLSKDAVYTAIGLTSFDIVEEVDFDMLFTTHLVHELKITHSNYRILRRRIIWLVGQWTDVRFSSANRPLLYEACIHLLSNDPDFVVRYHTAITLRTAIDDFDFDRKGFMPYLTPVVTLLFNLLKEAKECDNKLKVLDVLSLLIEVVGVEVREAAKPLVCFLPLLWADSEHHNLLRCAILTTLSHLVSCMGRDSMSMHDFMLKILHLSTDSNQACHVYLLEDGLHLWLCVLENTPSLPASVCGEWLVCSQWLVCAEWLLGTEWLLGAEWFMDAKWFMDAEWLVGTE
ncbi:Importin-beta N-terminal domain [Trinorchestia longiramus]|nr:Importin-beta N-terminal domain [Trinorchestia longiramus]